ncbi:MAG: hypothetical protein IPJ82_14175 [Lewinellaceae bacterium]|nr:hypothetical protein [Lewinellaceae bacterium]
MKDIFEFRRFFLLLKKTMLERPVQIAGFTGLMLLTSFALYAFCYWPLGRLDLAQSATFLAGLAVGGSYLASVVFGYFSNNARGYAFLTLPASGFEKWLCGVLVTGVLYPAVFILFFSIMDRAFVALYHNGLNPTAANYALMTRYAQVFALTGPVAQNVYTLFFVFAGAMLVGTLYFNKVSFVKVALILFGLFFFLYTFNFGIAKALMGDIGNAMPFQFVAVRAGYDFERIELPENWSGAVEMAIRYVFPASLWLIALVRLRDKEF